MRDIIRLSITLAVVAVFSALLLAVVHGVTEPIIIARQEEDYRAALEEYFPGFSGFETENIGDDYFDLIYDADGNLMGVMCTVIAMGYEGDIAYNLAVDEEGHIIGLRVIYHSETPGIGDVITTASFKEQFYGKTYEDPIAPGEDIDIISGATISTVAIITSVSRVIDVVAENFLGAEFAEEMIDLAEVPDGAYEGSASGVGGPIEVLVEVSSGQIVAIEVLDHSETPTYFIEAYPLIPEMIIEEQSLDVDTKTGATISADGIVDAVRDALLGALEEKGGGEGN